jgi:hypothetical protein
MMQKAILASCILGEQKARLLLASQNQQVDFAGASMRRLAG